MGRCFGWQLKVFRVNESIAEVFREKYGNEVVVIRNVPRKRQYSINKSRADLNLPEDKPIVLLQGSGINIQRGAEELVRSMQYLDDVMLLVIGGGDVMPLLYQMSDDLKLNKKIRFLPRQPFDVLYDYTVHADLGVTLDKDTNLNYRYSLPNKLFDYIHARVPVLASPIVEIKKIIDQYQVGTIIENHDPEQNNWLVLRKVQIPHKLEMWKENCKLATEELCWEREKSGLEEVYRVYV